MDRIRIGHVGLGRLGYLHARNLAKHVDGANLSALCDMDEQKLTSVAQSLGIPYQYTSFDEMIDSGCLDAVCIASSSAVHTKQIEAALESGLHVFCEKPLGLTVEECRQAERAVEAHPDKVFMLGFMRRFDLSYLYAKKMIDEGNIGRPILFRSYSQDPIKAIEGAIRFAPNSGGQFADMAVHDIDLMRWMTGSEPETVYAIGGCYAYQEFAQYNDGDNVSCLMKLKDGTMAFLFAGRTAPHGYNVETEIIGAKGTLRIASVPQKNLVEILDSGGVRKECSQDFIERFESAYLAELNNFIHCIATGQKPEVSVYDGTNATRISDGCRVAFQTGELFKF